jgi:hypothetical protein
MIINIMENIIVYLLRITFDPLRNIFYYYEILSQLCWMNRCVLREILINDYTADGKFVVNS